MKNYRLVKHHHQRHLTRPNLPSLMLSMATSYRVRIQIWEITSCTQMSHQIIAVKQMTLLCTLSYKARTVMFINRDRLVICTHQCRSDRHCYTCTFVADEFLVPYLSFLTCILFSCVYLCVHTRERRRRRHCCSYWGGLF